MSSVCCNCCCCCCEKLAHFSRNVHFATRTALTARVNNLLAPYTVKYRARSVAFNMFAGQLVFDDAKFLQHCKHVSKYRHKTQRFPTTKHVHQAAIICSSAPCSLSKSAARNHLTNAVLIFSEHYASKTHESALFLDQNCKMVLACTLWCSNRLFRSVSLQVVFTFSVSTVFLSVCNPQNSLTSAEDLSGEILLGGAGDQVTEISWESSLHRGTQINPASWHSYHWKSDENAAEMQLTSVRNQITTESRVNGKLRRSEAKWFLVCHSCSLFLLAELWGCLHDDEAKHNSSHFRHYR